MNVSNKYYQSVDLLRGVTALLVGMYHFVFYEDTSRVLFEVNSGLKKSVSILPEVVFVFFFLSGFVISMTMHKHKYHISKIGRFLLRRWVRIEIPYIVSILIYLLIAFVWSLRSGEVFVLDLQQLMHHLLYTTAVFDYSWYNDIYWTLALEFQFYILIALIFPLFLSKKMLVKYSAVTIFCLSGLLIEHPAFVFHYTPIFILGTLLFTWFQSDRKNHIDLLFMLLALVQISVCFNLLTVTYLLISIVIVNFSFSETNLFVRFGKNAYSYYLLHGAFGGTFIYFFAPKAENDFAKILIVIGALIVSLVLSKIFFAIIEKPSLKLSQKIKITE